jgi:hypothetical protein
MKLTVFKNLNEEAPNIQLSKAFEAGMMSDRKMVDLLAQKIQSDGFPEKFTLPVKISNGADLVLEFELYEKSINEQKGFHQVVFTYEHTRDTTIKIRALLKQAEKDDEDTDGEKYDELYDELKHDMIHVVAEFSDKFTKVYGNTK